MRLPWLTRKKHESVIAEWRRELFVEIEKNRSLDRQNRSLDRQLERSEIRSMTLAGRVREFQLQEVAPETPETPAIPASTCIACAAKDQTIALMADVVDFERARSTQPHQRQPAATDALSNIRITPTRPEDVESRMWVTDDEESIMAALQSGALGADPEEAYEKASKMLAAVGAANVEIVAANTPN